MSVSLHVNCNFSTCFEFSKLLKMANSGDRIFERRFHKIRLCWSVRKLLKDRNIFLETGKLEVKKPAMMRKKYSRLKNACLRQKSCEAEKIYVCSGKKLKPIGRCQSTSSHGARCCFAQPANNCVFCSNAD